jgi:PAS domain S-box-containing protein
MLVTRLRPFITPAAVLLTVGLFILDVATPFGVAVLTLYLIPLMLTLRPPDRRVAFLLASAYSALIVLGALFAHPGVPDRTAGLMRMMVVGVIWAATFLILRLKTAEETLFQQKKEQQVIFDSVPAMIWYKDRHNRILRANKTAADSIGRRVTEDEGRSVYDLYPEEAATYHQDDLEVIASGQPKLGIVEPYRTGSGEKRWIRTDKLPYRNEKGAVAGVIVFAQDITDSEQLAALEASMDGMAVTDANEIFTYANLAQARLHGCEQAQQLVGRSWRSLYDERELARFEREVLPRLSAEGQWRGEAVGRRRDGGTFPQELSLTRLEHGGVIWVVRDITERKRAEEALRRSEEQARQSQKLEAVGRLAGGIAHEFNNLLTVVTGYCQLLLSDLNPDDPASRKVEQINKAGHRAALLTNQLLAFSRKQVLQPVELDLNAVVLNLQTLLRPLIGEHIELVTALAPAPGRIRADRGQIEQALVNLVLNARDAMPQGGKLTISTAIFERDERLARKLGLARAQAFVRLEVRDTGVGMDASTLEHCFEPFFTTKGRGKGTGLGLATVYGIIEQSGGIIEMASEPGRGTSVSIFLPQVAAPVAPALAPQDQVADPATGWETILVAEDDDAVREVVRGMLETLGYKILEASRGQEALSICQEHQGPIHLLLTDVIMPGMNGQELAENMAALRPETRVLFMSGYTDDVALRPGSLEAGVAFIRKPATREELARKIRDVLDGKP